MNKNLSFKIKSSNKFKKSIEDEFKMFLDKSYYIDGMFNSIWQDGLNMNDESIIEKVLKNLNVKGGVFDFSA